MSDTIPFTIPSHWRWVPVGALNTRKNASVVPQKDPSAKFELYSVPIFPEGRPEIVAGRSVGSSKQAVAPGDVLICKINPRLNRVWIVGDYSEHPKIASSEWVAVRPTSDAYGPYLVYAFRSGYFRELLQSRVSGVGGSLTRARPKDVMTYPVPLPPLDEQKRIVARLDSMLGKIKQARELIQEARDSFADRRAAILAKAFRGELTAKWREENPDVEPAEKLLERIREEREKQEAASGKKKRKMAGGEDPIEEPYPLPAGWKWVRLGEVLHNSKPLGYGVLQPGQDTVEGVPLVRVCDIADGFLNTFQLKRIAQSIENKYARSRLEGGELLVTVVGTIGRTAIAPPSAAGFNIARAVAKVTLDPSLNNEFIHIYLESNDGQRSLRSEAREVARKTLNLKELVEILIPIAPLQEQVAILSLLAKVLAPASGAAELLQLEAILQGMEAALLARAFRGELSE